jgi:uncharacterized protein (DUF885 family)
LHGKHFDIPEPAQRIEAMIAPVNDGGIYYSEPSEDWSRPGTRRGTSHRWHERPLKRWQKPPCLAASS